VCILAMLLTLSITTTPLPLSGLQIMMEIVLALVFIIKVFKSSFYAPRVLTFSPFWNACDFQVSNQHRIEM